MILAIIRGLLLGIAAAIALGTVVGLGVTVHGWPSGEPVERARRLAEGIAEGLHVAFLASVIVVPGAVLWSVRRRRRRT